jgi:hypothetical protein
VDPEGEVLEERSFGIVEGDDFGFIAGGTVVDDHADRFGGATGGGIDGADDVEDAHRTGGKE